MRHGRPLVRNGLEVLRPQRHRRSGFGFRQLASRNHRADRFDMRAQAGQLGGFAAEPFQRGLLLALETLLAQRQLVEIHQMAVEIGAVHAGEFHFAAHRHAARSAHPGAIHHDRIQADYGGHAERPRGLRAGLHHRNRADGHHFARIRHARQHVGQRVGDEALAPIAAVVGGDDQLIAHRAELVFPKHQVAVAEPHDGDRAVAHLLVRAQLRINRRYAQAAAHQHHRARQFADLAGQPERPDEIQNRVSLAQRHHLKGGLADRLDDHRDGAARGIEVRYRQWDTLTVLVDAGHDEVARPRRPRHVGGRYFPQKCRWAELFPMGDDKHYTSPEATWYQDYG